MPKCQKKKIHLHGEFSATELEEVIRQIALARAAMIPQVAKTPPPETSEIEALEQTNAIFHVSRLADGGARVWLRNEGIGWHSFSLSASSKTRLAQFLIDEVTHPHRTH